jgi:hypothetical protein
MNKAGLLVGLWAFAHAMLSAWKPFLCDFLSDFLFYASLWEAPRDSAVIPESHGVSLSPSHTRMSWSDTRGLSEVLSVKVILPSALQGQHCAWHR